MMGVYQECGRGGDDRVGPLRSTLLFGAVALGHDALVHPTPRAAGRTLCAKIWVPGT
ncbi:MAG: hypothetical protein ACLSAF_16995 [Intestinimonas sp.]